MMGRTIQGMVSSEEYLNLRTLEAGRKPLNPLVCRPLPGRPETS